MNDFQALARRQRRQDLMFNIVGMACTALGLVVLAALLVDLAVDGAGRIDWQFLTSYSSGRAHRAGILAAWVGTLVIMLVTALAAVPLGIAAAVYLEEYAPRNWLTTLIEINITNLAGVPSIIFGLMGLGLLAQKFGLGETTLTGGITLGLLILPIVIVTTREALRAVPNNIREAAYAVGATKWQVIWHHLLPSATGGVATGTIIALSRAIGETAPLLVAGAVTFISYLPTPPLQNRPPFVNFVWTRDPYTVLPIQMFDWISRPSADFHANAAAAGLVLVGITLLMNGIAVVIRFRSRRRFKW